MARKIFVKVEGYATEWKHNKQMYVMFFIEVTNKTIYKFMYGHEEVCISASKDKDIEILQMNILKKVQECFYKQHLVSSNIRLCKFKFGEHLNLRF